MDREEEGLGDCGDVKGWGPPGEVGIAAGRALHSSPFKETSLRSCHTPALSPGWEYNQSSDVPLSPSQFCPLGLMVALCMVELAPSPYGSFLPLPRQYLLLDCPSPWPWVTVFEVF